MIADKAERAIDWFLYLLTQKQNIMKQILFILTSFLLLSSFAKLTAQEFAPVGAEWHYTMQFFMSEEERFVHIESIKDTVVSEKLCRMLEVEYGFSCYFYNEKEFVYQEDSIVYFYSPVVDDFQIMYDLKAKKRQLLGNHLQGGSIYNRYNPGYSGFCIYPHDQQ